MNAAKLNVIVVCEISGVIRDAFRALGHNAWSCDVQPSISPYHIQCDARHLSQRTDFYLWDIAILHPECRYLSVSGAHLFKKPGRAETEG